MPHRSQKHNKGRAQGSRGKCLFIEDVPEDERLNFKAACAKQNETMRQAVLNLMRLYVRRTNNSKTLRVIKDESGGFF